MGNEKLVCLKQSGHHGSDNVQKKFLNVCEQDSYTKHSNIS